MNIVDYLIADYGKWKSSLLESHPEQKTPISANKHLLKDIVNNMLHGVIGFTINQRKQIK